MTATRAAQLFRDAYRAGLGQTAVSHAGFLGFSGHVIEREAIESASTAADEENKEKDIKNKEREIDEKVEEHRQSQEHAVGEGTSEAKDGYNYDKNNGGLWQPIGDEGGDTSGRRPTY